MHYWKHGSIGEFVLAKPMVLGHESAGIVTAVGSEVANLKVGDRVALEPGTPCFQCENCLSGQYNQCAKMVFAATPPYDGTLATYYNLHSSFAHKVPDHMSLEEASLMEPLSVAVYATVDRGQVRPLQNVLVIGAGPIGLGCAGVARAWGAKAVTVVDIIDEKLEFAKQFAATHTFKSSRPLEGETPAQNAQRNAKLVAESTGGEVQANGGFDLVLECTGAAPCVAMGINSVRPKGRYVQVGMGVDNVTIPLAYVNVREVTVTGSFRYGAGTYRTAIDLVASGKLPISKIVTHRFAFDDAVQAFATTASGKGPDGRSSVKVQICQGPASPEVA